MRSEYVGDQKASEGCTAARHVCWVDGHDVAAGRCLLPFSSGHHENFLAVFSLHMKKVCGKHAWKKVFCIFCLDLRFQRVPFLYFFPNDDDCAILHYLLKRGHQSG